jgi:hypothetical protein
MPKMAKSPKKASFSVFSSSNASATSASVAMPKPYSSSQVQAPITGTPR